MNLDTLGGLSLELLKSLDMPWPYHFLVRSAYARAALIELPKGRLVLARLK